VCAATAATTDAARAGSTHHLLSYLGSRFDCNVPEDILRQLDTTRGATWSGNGSRRAFATIAWYLYVTNVLDVIEYVALVFMMCHTVTVSVKNYVAYSAIAQIYDANGTKLAAAVDLWSQHIETVRGSTHAIPTRTHSHEAALFAAAATGWKKVWRVVGLAVNSPDDSDRVCAVCEKRVAKLTDLMRHGCYASRFGEPKNDTVLRSNASLNKHAKAQAASVARQRKRGDDDDDDNDDDDDDGDGDSDDDADDKLRQPVMTRASKRARKSTAADTNAAATIAVCATYICTFSVKCVV
jgi:hypothetical protein